MLNKYESLMQQYADQGYGVIDDFFSLDLCTELRNNLILLDQQGALKKAGIGNQESYQNNTAIRSDFISWIDDSISVNGEKLFITDVETFIDYLNSNYHSEILSSEFHYAFYRIGSQYKRHLDQFKSNNTRLYSMITYLSEDWHEEDGGQLVLYLGDEVIRILPKAGRVVFFRSSELEHEVLTAHKERMSITGWLKR